jgi:hypothetical protein
MPSCGDMQTPRLVVCVRLFLFVTVGHHVLIVDSLPGRPVNLVELEAARSGGRGINFDRETNQ